MQFYKSRRLQLIMTRWRSKVAWFQVCRDAVADDGKFI